MQIIPVPTDLAPQMHFVLKLLSEGSRLLVPGRCAILRLRGSRRQLVRDAWRVYHHGKVTLFASPLDHKRTRFRTGMSDVTVT